MREKRIKRGKTNEVEGSAGVCKVAVKRVKLSHYPFSLNHNNG